MRPWMKRAGIKADAEGLLMLDEGGGEVRMASSHECEPATIRVAAPVPASQALQANLQRAVDAYTSRADTLTKEIETRQGEHADVMRARGAAVLALEALLGDVSVAAVEADLFDDSRVGSAGFEVKP